MAAGKNIEVKVGALILISMILLGGFIVVMGGLSVARVYTVFVDFDNPSGLQIGAPVKIAGVKVGKVDSLEYRGGKADPKVPWRALVRVKLSIEEKVRDSIHEDAQFVITTQGVLGEPFIGILPGDPEKPPLPEGSIRQGKDPPRLDLFLAQASDLMTMAHKALTREDGPLQDIAKHGASLIKGIDLLIIDNRETITRITKNTEKLSASAVELVQATKDKVDGPQVKRILNNVDVLTASLAKDTGPLLKKTQDTLAHLDEIATDTLGPEQRASIKKTLKEVENIAVSANKTANDVQAMVKHIKAGKGTVGALMMDEEIYDDLQEMLRDIKHNPWKLFWRE
ncbi:MAG: MCE family protein [Deltaproteobacteria bacterium]|nr:MCE family protein [Deltaproteobacteria bacterium]